MHMGEVIHVASEGSNKFCKFCKQSLQNKIDTPRNREKSQRHNYYVSFSVYLYNKLSRANECKKLWIDFAKGYLEKSAT